MTLILNTSSNFFGHKLESSNLRKRKKELRIMQLERDKKRGRKVLTLDEVEADNPG